MRFVHLFTMAIVLIGAGCVFSQVGRGSHINPPDWKVIGLGFGLIVVGGVVQRVARFFISRDGDDTIPD